MTVLRELIAKLGFEVDPAGFNRATAAVDKIRGAVRDADGRLRSSRAAFAGAGSAASSAASRFGAMSLGLGGIGGVLARIGGAAGVGLLGKKIIDLASDANETMNVIGQVFGSDGAERITDWSQRMGEEVGRSKFTLRDFVGQIGAMASPMVGNAKLAEEMSTNFAKLAVDLSSFFNTTEVDALAALKSGLAGMVEPLRRYGVDLTDATLQEFAHTQGIHKKITKMAVAEKAELRYRAIMAKTTAAQGDAARTGYDFANSSRALKDQIKDLATEMGMKVLPKIKNVVRAARDAIAWFRGLEKNTSALETALYVLGGVAAALGIDLLAPFILPAAAIIALILLIDDLNSMFAGGTSVVGTYIDTMFGLGATDALVRNHAAGVLLLKDNWNEFWADWKAGFEIFQSGPSLFELLETAGVNAFDAIAEAGTAVLDAIRGIQEALGVKLPQRVLTSVDRTKGRGVNAPLMTGQEASQQNLRDMNRVAKETAAERRAERTTRGTGRALERGVEPRADPLARYTVATPFLPRGAVEEVPFGRAAPSAVGASAAPTSVSAPAAAPVAKQNNVTVGDTNITINGSTLSLADLRKMIAQQAAAERRKTVAAVGQAVR